MKESNKGNWRKLLYKRSIVQFVQAATVLSLRNIVHLISVCGVCLIELKRHFLGFGDKTVQVFPGHIRWGWLVEKGSTLTQELDLHTPFCWNDIKDLQQTNVANIILDKKKMFAMDVYEVLEIQLQRSMQILDTNVLTSQSHILQYFLSSQVEKTNVLTSHTLYSLSCPPMWASRSLRPLAT